MKRIYKVLLPLYREAEMNSEIANEWLMDSRGLEDMSQIVLGKVLFRVAHWWSTNVDFDEYIDLMQRVYQRITYKTVYDSRFESVSKHYPVIQVTFPAEEKHISETVVRGISGGGLGGDTDWMECASNESNKSDFEYKYEEDPARMIVKKLKKRKQIGLDLLNQGANVNIKEPFIYNEEVTFPEVNDPRLVMLNCRSVYDVLIDLKDVFPFGYATEQFLRQTKQDIHNKVEEVIQKIRKARGNDEDEEAHAQHPDPGLIRGDSGAYLDIPVTAWGLTGGVKFAAHVTDTLYNNYRKQLRDGLNMSLRLYSQYPKAGARGKARTTAKDEPSFEVNKFGYNPSLERRLAYKYLPIASKSNELQFVNVNYLIDHPDFETAYRCDVQRIESKGKMAIKESDEIRREEEYVNVEASYRKMRQVMLQKKFETINRDHTNAD